MLGLRTAEGLDSGFLVSSCGKDRIYRMLSEGLLESIPEGNLRIPEEKMFVSEGIILDLI